MGVRTRGLDIKAGAAKRKADRAARLEAASALIVAANSVMIAKGLAIIQECVSLRLSEIHKSLAAHNCD
jgi:hypothetical protein